MTIKRLLHAAFALWIATYHIPAEAQTQTQAQPEAQTPAPEHYPWYFQTSLVTHHWSDNPKHVKHNVVLNLEYERIDGWIIGGAQFRNSFGQPSQYVYVGRRFRPLSIAPNLYLKITGGAVHGYKDEFRNKIPFNGSGVAPVILPSIGYDFGRRFSSEVVIFGTSGVMWTVGGRF